MITPNFLFILIFVASTRGAMYGNDALPNNLKYTNHWDYPFIFQWIPRSWTSFDWDTPKLIIGNQKRERVCVVHKEKAPAPIGEYGSWQVSRFPKLMFPFNYVPLYITFTTKSGRHFRIGARWDDIDNYVNFPGAAQRKYKAHGEEDTSTR